MVVGCPHCQHRLRIEGWDISGNKETVVVSCPFCHKTQELTLYGSYYEPSTALGQNMGTLLSYIARYMRQSHDYELREIYSS